MTRMMNIVASATLITLTGCQTRITATKNPENVLPIQSVATLNGTNVLITTAYEKASGGWEATARSPLWATESIKGLNIEVATNGTVKMAIDDYNRDLSTNAVIMTEKMLDSAVKLTEKVAAAIVTSGGSTAAEGVQGAVSALVAKYISEGGSAENATVTCKDGSCTISDGSVTCSDGSCYAQ